MTGEVSPVGHGDEVASPGERRASHEDPDRAPWGPDVPAILRIEVTGRVRSGHLRARPPRRAFWQWLLRRPRPYQPAAP
jgi:hypothetical protein